jgi:hypothetical protein
MKTKNFLTIVTLVTVFCLMASGCSGISYAAALTFTPTTLIQTPTFTPMSTEPSIVQEPAHSEVLSVTQDELVGTWFNGTYLEFKSNGFYSLYNSLEARQAGDNSDEGQYGLQGDQLWMGPMSSYCNGMGFYQLTSKSEDELEFTLVKEECSRTLGKMQRVTP